MTPAQPPNVGWMTAAPPLDIGRTTAAPPTNISRTTTAAPPNTGRRRANAISLVNTPPRNGHGQEMQRLFYQARSRTLFTPRPPKMVHFEQPHVEVPNFLGPIHPHLLINKDKIEEWLDNVGDDSPEKQAGSDDQVSAEDQMGLRGGDSSSRVDLPSARQEEHRTPTNSQYLINQLVAPSPRRPIAKIPARNGVLNKPPQRDRRRARESTSTRSSQCSGQPCDRHHVHKKPRKAEDVADLSPHVQCRRKNKPSNKQRCGSYFDEDVLPHLSPKGSTHPQQANNPSRRTCTGCSKSSYDTASPT